MLLSCKKGSFCVNPSFYVKDSYSSNRSIDICYSQKNLLYRLISWVKNFKVVQEFYKGTVLKVIERDKGPPYTQDQLQKGKAFCKAVGQILQSPKIAW